MRIPVLFDQLIVCSSGGGVWLVYYGTHSKVESTQAVQYQGFQGKNHPDTYIHTYNRQRCFTLTQCHSVSTLESEVRNSLSALEPHSMDSLGHQPCTKKLSPQISLHFKVLCESKVTLPYTHDERILEHLQCQQLQSVSQECCIPIPSSPCCNL